MKLALSLAYTDDLVASAKLVAEYERVGLDRISVAEAYGFDAVSFLGFLAGRTERIELASGILPVFTRTPALVAMTAASLDELSGGRFILGLGTSGPQVVEGFHGIPFDKPLRRTRELVEICRQIWRRRGPLIHHGEVFTVPLPQTQGTGLARPLKLLTHPRRPDIPVCIAAMGAKNVEMTAEIADGWFPMFYIPEFADSVFGEAIKRGYSRRDPARGSLEITVAAICAVGDGPEVTAVREQARTHAALYIGGMGSKDQNYYNRLIVKYGYQDAAANVQNLYLAGNRSGAEAAVPASLLDRITLCGSEGYIQERLAAYAQAGVSVLAIDPRGPGSVLHTIETMKRLIDEL